MGENQTWYRIGRYSFSTPISPVEVVKVTPQQVVFIDKSWGNGKERRANKAAEFFPSFAEAKEYLIQAAQRELQNADDHRSRVIEKLKKYRNLEPLDDQAQQ